MGLFKKQNGGQGMGFIKRGTGGTSNEISFSVLDRASGNMEGGTGAGSNADDLGKLQLFTLPGKKGSNVGSTPSRDAGLALIQTAHTDREAPASTLPQGKQKSFIGAAAPSAARGNNNAAKKSFDDEVKRRKTRRLVSKVAAGFVAVAALVAVIGVGAQYLYSDYKTNQTYEGVLGKALQEINQADDTLAIMDASFANLLNEESMTAMAQAKEDAETCRAHLDSAEALANHAADNFTAAQEKEYAAQAQNAITARRQMLETGLEIIDITQKGAWAIEQLDKGWNYLLSADSQVRTAVLTISSLEAEPVHAAIATLDNASSDLSAANECYDSLEDLYDVDLTMYHEYVSCRTEAITHLRAALNAVLDDDTATAATEMEQYNQYDAEATGKAATLSEDSSQLVKDALLTVLKPLSDAYSNACSQAGKADEVLRSYINSKS